ncbi:diaminopimelate epimerase [Clostridium sp.]|uniref:diaminopimelate epimerase n=1 Tax=Clostridium sp. TaxID=1506 RepID=UPI002634727F|nr:diaminopimelate epimerase [uncultured Clostridium sp.]
MTVFILDHVPRQFHINVANKIMEYGSINAEQVGFIEKHCTEEGKSKNCVRLQMMGGEFCGNAARSLAAILVDKNYSCVEMRNEKFIVPLEVSGFNGVINCEVERLKNNNEYNSKIVMPLVKSTKDFYVNHNGIVYKCFLVEFPGIIHLIVDCDGISDKEGFFLKVKSKLEYAGFEALGVMFYDYKKLYMEPLVYVKRTDSLFWEKSCASGTSALAVALTQKQKRSLDILVKQPGGELQVTTKWDNGCIKKICLNGKIKIVAEGKVYM